MQIQLGRHVFGLTAIGFGVCAIVWHDYNTWQQMEALRNPSVLLYVIAAVEILGGVAIQFTRTARAGAAALAIVYFVFALMRLPVFFEKPAYDQIGNFFEQFSLVSGALIIYGWQRIGYYGFGVSVVSFTLEQLVYLHGTAAFVPKWIPPGQMFWAVTTTIAFALAAIALLTDRAALLAARLTTLMIAGFGFLVWLPTLWTSTFFADAGSLTASAGNFENWAIAGSAWIVADYLSSKQQLADNVVLQHATR
jgi:uncharacterized membrane protein YphA (DoxX/SURF4 family)